MVDIVIAVGGVLVNRLFSTEHGLINSESLFSSERFVVSRFVLFALF